MIREISPAKNLSAEEYLASAPYLRPTVTEIREQKRSGARSKPSTSLLDGSQLLNPKQRAALLDKIAALVDENLTGRSDMCIAYGQLLHRALMHLGFGARLVCGTAEYFDDRGRRVWSWDHCWVRVGKEVVDGNIDSLAENPMADDTVRSMNIRPYWGPIDETPADRRLRERNNMIPPPDNDVEAVWWPDLRTWLEDAFTDLA